MTSETTMFASSICSQGGAIAEEVLPNGTMYDLQQHPRRVEIIQKMLSSSSFLKDEDLHDYIKSAHADALKIIPAAKCLDIDVFYHLSSPYAQESDKDFLKVNSLFQRYANIKAAENHDSSWMPIPSFPELARRLEHIENHKGDLLKPRKEKWFEREFAKGYLPLGQLWNINSEEEIRVLVRKCDFHLALLPLKQLLLIRDENLLRKVISDVSSEKLLEYLNAAGISRFSPSLLTRIIRKYQYNLDSLINAASEETFTDMLIEVIKDKSAKAEVMMLAKGFPNHIFTKLNLRKMSREELLVFFHPIEEGILLELGASSFMKKGDDLYTASSSTSYGSCSIELSQSRNAKQSKERLSLLTKEDYLATRDKLHPSIVDLGDAIHGKE